MIDEITGTRYIFARGDDYGIVTSLLDVDLSECTKLTDPITSETRYCEEYYYSECAVVTPDCGSYAYVIPEYMLRTIVEEDNQGGYQVAQDSNSNRWFYVPNALIEQCEDVVSAFYESHQNETDSEVSDIVIDMEIPDDEYSNEAPDAAATIAIPNNERSYEAPDNAENMEIPDDEHSDNMIIHEQPEF